MGAGGDGSHQQKRNAGGRAVVSAPCVGIELLYKGEGSVVVPAVSWGNLSLVSSWMISHNGTVTRRLFIRSKCQELLFGVGLNIRKVDSLTSKQQKTYTGQMLENMCW